LMEAFSKDYWEGFVAPLGVEIGWVEPGGSLPGTFWGEPEAGLVGSTVYVRGDTPVHSFLHELCHLICMDPQRRATLHREAGGTRKEEEGVCYLQVVLARDHLRGVGMERLLADMDAWGYNFVVGSAKGWFETDAADARQWLIDHGLLTEQDRYTGRLQGE